MAKLTAAALTLIFAAGTSAAPAPPPGAGRMLRQLDGGDWIQQAEALDYLADQGVTAATDPIRAIAEAEASPPWIRGRALVALCQLEGGERPPALLVSLAGAGEATLRTAAAEALEHYTGEEAQQLVSKLSSDPDPHTRFRALATLARMGGESAWPVIDAPTRSPEPGLRPLAARALAFTGTDEALARLPAIVGKGRNADSAVRLLSDIRNPKLIPIYLSLLETLNPDGHAYAGLLSAIAGHERSATISALRGALESGREPATIAASRTITMLVEAPELGGALQNAIGRAKNTETIRAGLIALGARGMEPDAHRELFATYLKHDDPELRALAIRCLAHCESANLYEALSGLIDDGDTVVRHAALSTLLRAPPDQAPTGGLVAYLEPALVSADDATRQLGFELLGHAGSADDFLPAIAMLGDALRGNDTARREAVAAALGSIAPEDGVAPVARSQGYVTGWMVVGTFLNDLEHAGFAKEFPPEKTIDFEASYPSTYVWALDARRRKKDEQPIEREVGWEEVKVDRTDGRLRLGPLLPPPGTLSVAYAVADFRVLEEREILLDVDGDDAFRLWLNGEELASVVAPYQHNQPCVASKFGIKVTLKAGDNRLLAKSANIDGDWWLRVRLTDAEERPVEVGDR